MAHIRAVMRFWGRRKRRVQRMTIAKKMQYLMVIYGEIYYQERVAEELKKTDYIYDALPEIPPKSDNSAGLLTAGGAFLILLLITSYLLFRGSLYFFITGIIGFVALIVTVDILADGDKKNFQRNQALKEYEAVKSRNSERKKEYPEIKRVLDAFAREYDKAQEKSEKKAKEICDALQLASRYRNYSSICSLYQYLYTETDITLAQACSQLDAFISTGNYVSNPAQAMRQAERVKNTQPVWVERLPRQEENVIATTKYLRNRAAWIAHKNKSEGLSGDSLDYELAKYVADLREKAFDWDYCQGESAYSSMLNVKVAYNELIWEISLTGSY